MHDPTAFERFLLAVSTRLTAGAEVEAALDGVLRDIGEALGTDRVTLLQYLDGGARVAATQAWARPGFEAAAPGAPLAEELPWCHGALLGGEVVALGHVDADLPASAPRDREFARAADLKSHLSVPIAVAGQLECVLSTSTFRHYCRWSDRLIDRVRLVGQMVAQALIRVRAAREVLPPQSPDAIQTRAGASIRRLDDVERDYILRAIDRCGGKINGRGHAAELLGLHPNTLRSRMKKLGIQRRARRAPAL